MKKRMNHGVHMAVVCVLLGFANTASAAEETKVEALNTIEVNAILPEKLEAVPGSFDVITEKELDTRSPFSMIEAFASTPGVNVVGEDGYGFRLNIGVRGLNPRRTARTLLMEDGMPLFLAPYGDPSAHYSTPLDRVQRIEVVKGSGQILYGPQTVGGMINFVTRPVPTDGAHGRLTGMIGENDFRGFHVNVGVGDERAGVMLDAVQKRGDGIRDNHDTDWREYTLTGRLNINDSHTLIAKGMYNQEHSNQTETGLGSVEYDEDPYQAPTGRNDNFKHKRRSIQLKHLWDIADTARLTTQAYYARSYRVSFRQINDPGDNGGRSALERCPVGVDNNDFNNADSCGGRHRPRSYDYWGIEPRLDFSHRLFGIESDAVIGFRYHEENIRRRQVRGNNASAQDLSFLFANAEQPGVPASVADLREDISNDITTKSYYAQNTFFIDDWSITPGVRVEDIKNKTQLSAVDGNATNVSGTNNQTLTLPGLGVAWNGIANTTIFGGVHKGFAPPRPNRDLDEDNIELFNTKPEESTNWELGVRSNYYKGISFQSTLFHTDFDDIVIQETAGRFVNAGESEMTGLEFAGRVDFGQLLGAAHNIYLQGSYTNLFTAEFAKETDQTPKGNRLPYAPRHTASLSIGYQHPIGLDARFGVDYVGQQFVDRENTAVESLDGMEGTIPSYTLLNLSVNYRPIGSQFTYFLSGYNLADKEFLISRVDGMQAGRQRQVFGGVRYAF